MAVIYHNIMELIGNTPLVEVENIEKEGVTLYEQDEAG